MYGGKSNSSVRFTDWNKLLSATPQSRKNADKTAEKLKRQLVEVGDLFEKATNLEVIDTEGYISKLDEESVEAIETACAEYTSIVDKGGKLMIIRQ